MRRTRILFILVLALVLVVPTAPASAQNVVSKGTFVGFVNVDCGQSPITSFTCSVSGSSSICVEVVAGTAIGGSCSVSFSGEVNGVGVNGGPCLAFGSGGGSVGSRTGGYGHDGLITMDATVGNYAGQGDAGATGVAVELEFATTGCGTPIVDGPMRGSFVTHLSP